MTSRWRLPVVGRHPPAGTQRDPETESTRQLSASLTAPARRLNPSGPCRTDEPRGCRAYDGASRRSVRMQGRRPGPARHGPHTPPSSSCRTSRRSFDVELASNPDAAEILHNTSPSITSGWVEDHCPELAARIRRHLGDYAWLWSRPQPCHTRTPLDLVERIQTVLLRWPVDAIGELAAPRTTPSFETALRFSPSDQLAELLGTYRRLTADVGCRMDVLDKAQCIAAPFFAHLADAVGCTSQELLWNTPHEIDAALAGCLSLRA
jgi:hypothetical protein